MSDKTVGWDWRLAPRKRYTLRHAAGSKHYTTNNNTPKVSIHNIRTVDGDITIKKKTKKK